MLLFSEANQLLLRFLDVSPSARWAWRPRPFGTILLSPVRIQRILTLLRSLWYVPSCSPILILLINRLQLATFSFLNNLYIDLFIDHFPLAELAH